MATRSYFYSVGKRKTAIARVKIFEGGKGDVTINELPMKKYLAGVQIENAIAPLALTSTKTQFDVEVQVLGGGKSAQSDAIRHGITRALLLFNPEFRHDLKQAGFLRRDSRTKERKKPGLHRARRAPQFSKR
jgi:small subunit ribosomal protein S9